MKAVLLSLGFFLFTWESTFAQCLALRFEELEALLQHEPATQIIFFASWCGSCKKHFEDKTPKKRIFIATFDKKTAAESVMTKFQIQDSCYLDDGIAKRLSIQSLPQVRLWENGQIRERSSL